jgi:RNA polymerase sigma-70 factor, ECF subfamily
VAVFLAVLKKLLAEDQPSRAELMEQPSRREPWALERLYDRYARPVYSLLLRIAQQAACAEEIVQDIFPQLWRNTDLNQAGRRPLEPWLFTLARNRALDHARLKREKQRRREETLDEQPFTCGAPNPEQLMNRERRAERGRRLMGSLPPQQRQAIELAFFEGMTRTEIAEALREPPGTVKSRIRAGLLRLRESLEAAS